jgi:hypothetical protein
VTAITFNAQSYIVDKEIKLCAVAIYPLVERCSQVP